MWPDMQKGVLYKHSVFELWGCITQGVVGLQLWNLETRLCNLYANTSPIKLTHKIINEVIHMLCKIKYVYKTLFSKSNYILALKLSAGHFIFTYSTWQDNNINLKNSCITFKFHLVRVPWLSDNNIVHIKIIYNKGEHKG